MNCISAMVDPASVDVQIKQVGPTLMGQNTSKKTKGMLATKFINL